MASCKLGVRRGGHGASRLGHDDSRRHDPRIRGALTDDRASKLTRPACGSGRSFGNSGSFPCTKRNCSPCRARPTSIKHAEQELFCGGDISWSCHEIQMHRSPVKTGSLVASKCASQTAKQAGGTCAQGASTAWLPYLADVALGGVPVGRQRHALVLLQRFAARVQPAQQEQHLSAALPASIASPDQAGNQTAIDTSR